MASVSEPTATDVRRYTGLSEDITGETAGEFNTRLESFVTDAAGESALAVGEGSFDGTGWTARQAAALKRAVGLRAGAAFLMDATTRKRMGTQEALLMEEGESIDTLIEKMVEQAVRLEGLATAGYATPPAFARPVCSSSTFTTSSTDRSPSERNDLLDERDDIAASDLDNG